MTTLTDDDTAVVATSGRVAGFGFAVLSAASFGLAGALASGLMDAGWTAAGAVTARVGLAAAVLLVPTLVALDGRWRLLLAHWRSVVAYGAVAVAGCQLAFFNAVRHMDVGAALLIEYTAPVAVIGWLWLRHGQRPGRITVAGSAVAGLGLVLVLDLFSGADVSAAGVLWALAAMVGVAVYFIVSAQETGLPAIVLAGAGLVVGVVVLLAAALVGLVDLEGSTQDVTFTDLTVPFWVPIAGLGIVAGAIAYIPGILAARLLGSRLASFVALLEVLFALVFAWLLLDQLPGAVQLAGGLLVLGGVVLVKLGEKGTVAAGEPESALAATG